MTNLSRINLRLPPALRAAASKAAAEKGLSFQSYIENLLERELLGENNTQGFTNLEYEGQLLRWLEQTADDYAREGNWDEHVTLAIFERMQVEVPDLYDAAIASGQRQRINQEIGIRVRRRLGAVPKTRNGRRILARVPAKSPAPIRAYTLLQRPHRGDADA